MIKRSDLRDTLMLDFYQIMSNVSTHLGTEDLDALKLTNVVTGNFNPAFAKLDETMKPLYKSGLTEQILHWDNLRDQMVVGLRTHLKAATRNPDNQIATNATKLLEVMDNYGKNLQRKPMREETGIITNLLQDYAKPEYAPLVQSAAAEPYTTKLGEYNSQLENAYNDRTRIQAAIEVGIAKESREAMQKAFSTLVKTINAYAFLEGKEPYQQLANHINQEVKQAMQTVSLRKKSGDTAAPASGGE
ncbi:MAG: DUF6261 family protein [Bacteroidia bacterium]|nr:DUF6261 family protein [Bacteroidia bacterium]